MSFIKISQLFKIINCNCYLIYLTTQKLNEKAYEMYFYNKNQKSDHLTDSEVINQLYNVHLNYYSDYQFLASVNYNSFNG